MRYLDLVRVWTRSGTVQDADGVVISSTEVVLYDGRGEVQPGGRLRRRSPEGTPAEIADAEVFLPRGISLADVGEGASVRVTRVDGTVLEGRVLEVDDYSWSLAVRWLRRTLP